MGSESGVRHAAAGPREFSAPEPRPRKRKTPYTPPRWSSRLYVRLKQEHIALFKFLLEAHGHLGYMSVVDRHAAILKLSFSPDCEREMREFLTQARTRLPLDVIEI
jgi:hypothetical protein